jgi:hypothetical protein
MILKYGYYTALDCDKIKTAILCHVHYAPGIISYCWILIKKKW